MDYFTASIILLCCSAGNEQTAREAKEFGATVFTYTVDCSKKEEIYEAGEKVKRDVGQVRFMFSMITI